MRILNLKVFFFFFGFLITKTKFETSLKCRDLQHILTISKWFFFWQTQGVRVGQESAKKSIGLIEVSFLGLFFYFSGIFGYISACSIFTWIGNYMFVEIQLIKVVSLDCILNVGDYLGVNCRRLYRLGRMMELKGTGRAIFLRFFVVFTSTLYFGNKYR